MTTPSPNFEGEPVEAETPASATDQDFTSDKLNGLVAFLEREFPGEYNGVSSLPHIFSEAQRLFTLQSKWLDQALEEQERLSKMLEREEEAPRLVGKTAPRVDVAVQTYNATIVGRLAALAAIATVGLVSGSPAFMWPLVVLGAGGIMVDNLIALLVKKMDQDKYSYFLPTPAPSHDHSRGIGIECLPPTPSPLPAERPGSF